MDRLVTIKSCGYGMELHLNGEVSFDVLLKGIQEKFYDSRKFFHGSRIAVGFFGRRLSYLEEETILDTISEMTGLEIVCIMDGDPKHKQTYKSIVERTLSNISRRDGQFYRGTLGKRQVIESDTSIILIGNVERGAKVVSKGSIVVIGRLEGFAFAGASGDRNASITALTMQPAQLGIGDLKVKQPLCQEYPEINGPGIASAAKGRIYIEPLIDGSTE